MDLWYSIENAALEVMRTGQAVGIKGLIIAREIEFNKYQIFLTIKLPSRRKLFYAKPFLQTNEMGREALYYRGMNQETKKLESISTYGGKLTENIMQEIDRDYLAESLKRLEAAGYQTCFHVHDEVILDMPKDKADLKAVTDIMGQPIAWAPGLLLTAEEYGLCFIRRSRVLIGEK